MEENNKMTAERSLEIISEQIEQSRLMVNKNLSWGLIWWGIWVIVFALLVAWLWEHCGGPVWNWLWAVMWLIGYGGEWFMAEYKRPVPPTFISKTIGQVWGSFGVFIGFIGFVFGLIGCRILPVELVVPDGHVYINITSIISLCFGMASTLTGFILKNRIVQVCGIIAGLGGFWGALHYPWFEQLYVMAAVAFVGLVMPGLVICFKNQK